MPQLEAVDHDPFVVHALEPVDHDPWADGPSPADIASMTHQPEGPNPAQPYLDAANRYLQSGDYEPVHLPGTKPADYLRELSRNPDILAKNVEQASNFNFAGVSGRTSAFWNDVNTARMRDLLEQGVSTSKIAKELGTTRNTVIGKANRMDLPPSGASPGTPPSMWTDDLVNSLRDFHAQGITDTAMEKKLGIDKWSIGDKRRELGLPVNHGNRGVRNIIGTPEEEALKAYAPLRDADREPLPLARTVLSRDASGRPLTTQPFRMGNEDAVLEAGAGRYALKPVDHDPFATQH
jgi:hypothetical protein